MVSLKPDTEQLMPYTVPTAIILSQEDPLPGIAQYSLPNIWKALGSTPNSARKSNRNPSSGLSGPIGPERLLDNPVCDKQISTKEEPTTPKPK